MNSGDYFKQHGKLSYALWSLGIFIIGVSIASLLTQGALALKDKLAGGSDGDSIKTKVADAGTMATSSEERSLGSDEGSSQNSSGPTHQYTLSGVDSFPRLTAGAYLAADLQTGEIILENNEGLVAPIASVSKLMTALIAYEEMDLQKEAIVSRDAYNTYGAEGSLVLGEKIRLYDLMRPLLMESSNDGAEVFADSYPEGHAAFMAEMNKKAQSLGMTDTYYEDPSGLNPKNVSTVEDLLKLGRYVYQTQPEIYDITRVRQYNILKHKWTNQNHYLNYDSFVGGKNGYIDEAKKTTVSLFNFPMAKGGSRTVVIVLLKSDDREGDGIKIVNFLKKDAYFDPTN